jgi:Fe-S-cluster containining protein
VTTRYESRDVHLAALCQSCGMCCDGSLFGRARLTSSEVDLARRLHLPVVANGRSFALPCPALVTRGADRQCEVYADRPEACRQFVCALYARHERTGRSLDEGLAVVRRAKALLVFLDHVALASRARDDASSYEEEAYARMAAWAPVSRELAEILDLHFARAIIPGEAPEERAWRRSPAQVAACEPSRPRVAGKRRRVEKREDGHRTNIERIERGVGRPLAPPIGPPGGGGHGRESAKYRRVSGSDARRA